MEAAEAEPGEARLRAVTAAPDQSDPCGLISLLTDELLHKILLAAGAPAVARAATLCRRLRGAQQHLASLPAFASAASIVGDDEALADCVRAAVGEAREQMAAAVDVCLLFVAGSPHGRARGIDLLEDPVPLCQSLLPPDTLVVGCDGRGIFGTKDGAGVEIDPSQSRGKGASVLLGRLPGVTLRALCARDEPAGGWASTESCREWLGLDAGSTAAAGSSSAAARPGLEPLSCLLFAHPSASIEVYDAVSGLQAAFPGMLLTGGIASGMGELFCSHTQPPPQPTAAPDGQQAGGAAGSEAEPSSRRARRRKTAREAAGAPLFVGLLVCQPQADSSPAGSTSSGAPGSGQGRFLGGGLSAMGMQGTPEPFFTRLGLVRHFGVLRNPNSMPEEMELLALVSAYDWQGGDARPKLTRLAHAQMELGLWAGSTEGPGTFDEAAAAGQPVVVVQLYGEAEDGETMATANDEAALGAVLEAAGQPGYTLCGQRLKLSPEAAKEALRAGVARLAAAQPPRHPLLPTATCGLVAVSCTAKGAAMYVREAAGVEAGIMFGSSGQLPMAGAYCDGEIGPEVQDGKAALRWAGAASTTAGAATAQAGSGSKLQGFTTIVTALSALPH